MRVIPFTLKFGKSMRLFRREYPRINRYLVFIRFMEFVVVGDLDDCWEWTGKLDPDGYGHLYWGEKHTQKACVVAYELFVGKRGKLFVCHSCDNPACVNPKHLWLGTQSQNMQDMWDKKRHSLTDYRGENNPSSKLTSENVREIRKLYKHDNRFDTREIAKRFNITDGAVYSIVHKRTWKKVK